MDLKSSLRAKASILKNLCFPSIKLKFLSLEPSRGHPKNESGNQVEFVSVFGTLSELKRAHFEVDFGLTLELFLRVGFWIDFGAILEQFWKE